MPLFRERKYDYEGCGDTFKQLQAAAESKASSSAGNRSQLGGAASNRSNSGGDGGAPTDDEEDEGDEEDDDAAAGERKPHAEAGCASKDIKATGSPAAFNLNKLKKRGAKNKKGADDDGGKASPAVEKEESGKKKGKASNRQWWHGPEGGKLDFSDKPAGNGKDVVAPLERAELGKSKVDEDDDFDYDQGDDEDADKESKGSGGGSWFSNVLRNVVGKEALERSDVQPVLDQLKLRLMSKNVAEVIEEKLC